MKKTFRTKYGHDIAIRENYRRGCPPLFDPAEYREDKKQGEESTFGILCDIYEFSILVDWLAGTGIPLRRFGKLLDVGGNTGLIARLFHGSGMASQAYCLDKSDFAASLPMGRVGELLRNIQRTGADTHTLERRGGKHTPGTLARKIGYFLEYLVNRSVATGEDSVYFPLTLVYHTIKTCQNLYPAPFPEAMFKLDPEGDYTLAEFLHADYYALEDTFDCITSFSSFDHFTPSAYFQNAHRLLKDGGVLMMWHCNWYALLCPPAVYGDFPFACQRLERDDLRRYFTEYYPAETERALKAYDYYHNGEPGYTVRDYLEIAGQNGFRAAVYHRLMPPDGRLPQRMANWTFQGDHGPAVLEEVLRDIHCFKKDVTAEDLLTHSFFFVFEKIRGAAVP